MANSQLQSSVKPVNECCSNEAPKLTLYLRALHNGERRKCIFHSFLNVGISSMEVIANGDYISVISNFYSL